MNQFSVDGTSFYISAVNRIRRARWNIDLARDNIARDEGKFFWDRQFGTDEVDAAIKDLQHAKAELEAASKQAALAKEFELQSASE